MKLDIFCVLLVFQLIFWHFYDFSSSRLIERCAVTFQNLVFAVYEQIHYEKAEMLQQETAEKAVSSKYAISFHHAPHLKNKTHQYFRSPVTVDYNWINEDNTSLGVDYLRSVRILVSDPTGRTPEGSSNWGIWRTRRTSLDVLSL